MYFYSYKIIIILNDRRKRNYSEKKNDHAYDNDNNPFLPVKIEKYFIKPSRSNSLGLNSCVHDLAWV